MSLLLLFHGGATAYTLAAGAGSYTFTGTAATLRHSDLIGAGAGSYAFTGTAATLKLGRKISAGAGAYTFTGTAATLKLGRKASAGAGSYAFTGTAATLKLGRLSTAGAGSYAFTGQAATLIYTIPQHYSLLADPGTYLFTGTAATLRYAPFVVPDLMDMHDGSPRSDSQEAETRKTRDQRKSIRETIERRINPQPPEPEPVTAETIPPKPLPEALTRLLREKLAPPTAPIIPAPDVVIDYRALEAARLQAENDDLAIVMLLSS